MIRAFIDLWLRQRKFISKIDSLKHVDSRKNAFLLVHISVSPLHFLGIAYSSNVRIFEDESRIWLDKSMKTYGLTNPWFDIEYSNIRIRPSQNSLHCFIEIMIRHFILSSICDLISTGDWRQIRFSIIDLTTRNLTQERYERVYEFMQWIITIIEEIADMRLLAGKIQQ